MQLPHTHNSTDENDKPATGSKLNAIVRRAADDATLTFVIMDATGCIVYANKSARFEIVRALGKFEPDTTKWIAINPKSQWHTRLRETLVSGEQTLWISRQEHTDGAAPTWVKTVFSPIPDETGNIAFIHASLWSVDSEVRAQRNLEDEQKELRKEMRLMRWRVAAAVVASVIGGFSWLVIKPVAENYWPRLVDMVLPVETAFRVRSAYTETQFTEPGGEIEFQVSLKNISSRCTIHVDATGGDARGNIYELDGPRVRVPLGEYIAWTFVRIVPKEFRPGKMTVALHIASSGTSRDCKYTYDSEPSVVVVESR